MKAECTWRGVQVEVADIARALQSCRGFARAMHNVVFGDGADGIEHYIECDDWRNKLF